MTKRDSVSAPIRISVVIPHLNQPAHLRRCLESLMSAVRVPDEIFVVDNGSQELPTEVVDACAPARLLSEATPGPGPARNTGVAASSGEVLAFIDADCLADAGWLAAVEANIAHEEGAEVLGGDVRIHLVDPDRVTVLEAYESIYAYRMDRYIAREGFTGTGNLAMTRAIFDDVGPFGGLEIAEDRDWGQRATKAGYAIRFVPEMRVYHPARTEFAGLAAKWRRQTAHDYVRDTESLKGRVRFWVKTLAMPLSPLGEIPRIVRCDRLRGVGVKLKAFAGLCRIRLYRAWIMLRLVFGADPLAMSGAWNRD